jgi:thiol-disulfide isomerase/thioredoxin
VGSTWVNASRPITLASRKGKVTIVEFWTFGCINCRRNLPAYARWSREFASNDVAVIGVHTPETPSEAVESNVQREVKRLGIDYPILLDNEQINWNHWRQEFWPTVYVIDKRGTIRYRWEGELEYNNAGGTKKIAELVTQLLAEN